MSPNVNGAVLMMASMAFFTFNDTAIKLTDGALPLGQLLTLRGIFSTLLIYALARYLGTLRFNLRPRDWILVGIRSVSEIASAFFFITALMNMPLANISAIMQALPLTVTLGSALAFRETVGWKRALAIGVGFVGMLLIVKPGTDGFNVWSLYGVLAVLSVTVRDLATRRLSPEVPGMTVTLSSALAVLLFFSTLSLGETWQPVTPALWALLAGSSVFIFGGYYFSVQVMRTGDIAFIAPFRYTGLVWALVLGWLFFGDWPAPLTLLGAGIVVGMGLFTLYRERLLLKR